MAWAKEDWSLVGFDLFSNLPVPVSSASSGLVDSSGLQETVSSFSDRVFLMDGI